MTSRGFVCCADQDRRKFVTMFGTIQTLRQGPGGGTLIIVAAALCISLSNVLAPLVYAAGSNAYTLLVLRYCGFLAICGVWLCIQRVAISLTLTDTLACCGAGFAYALGAGALLASFSFVSVSVAILIFFTFPLLTRISESVLDRHRPSFMNIGCLTGAFAGLAILLGTRIEQLNWLGPALAMLASVGVAGSYVWTGRTLKHVQPIVMTFVMSSAGLLFALVLVAVTDGWRMALTGATGWFVLAVAVLSFSMAFLAMFAGVRPASRSTGRSRSCTARSSGKP